jgi:hypothetical protein
VTINLHSDPPSDECVPPMEETMEKIMETFARTEALLRYISEQLDQRDLTASDSRTLG